MLIKYNKNTFTEQVNVTSVEKVFTHEIAVPKHNENELWPMKNYYERGRKVSNWKDLAIKCVPVQKVLGHEDRIWSRDLIPFTDRRSFCVLWNMNVRGGPAAFPGRLSHPPARQQIKCKNLGNGDTKITPIWYWERFLTERKSNPRRAQTIMNSDACNWCTDYHPCPYVLCTSGHKTHTKERP